MTRVPDAAPAAEPDLPIEVYAGNFIFDSGLASLPIAFFRYYPYLESQGERLTDGEAMLLAQVLALRVKNAAGEYALRGSNLPRVSHHPRSLDRAKAKLRQLGLLFTRRLYFPTRPGQAPVMRAQQWDVRPLFHNLARLHSLWLKGQQALKAPWKAAGHPGPAPVYQFPDDFALATDIPLEVAFDLCRHKIYRGRAEYVVKPVPDLWRQRAQVICQTAGLDLATIATETDLPYPPSVSGTTEASRPYRPDRSRPTLALAPYRTDLASHRVKDSEEEKEEEISAPSLSDEDFDHFAMECLRSGGGHPSPKDAATLQTLRARGCSRAAWQAAVDEAAARQARGQIRRFNLAYCAKLALQEGSQAWEHSENAENGKARRRPSPVRPSASPAPTPPESTDPLGPDLALPAVVALCQAAGRPLTQAQQAVLASERQTVHTAALRLGETGDQWVLAAVQAALAVNATRVTSYALKTLRDWQHHGRPGPTREHPEPEAPDTPVAPENPPTPSPYANEP